VTTLCLLEVTKVAKIRCENDDDDDDDDDDNDELCQCCDIY
jgi:hypothetical protein